MSVNFYFKKKGNAAIELDEDDLPVVCMLKNCSVYTNFSAIIS